MREARRLSRSTTGLAGEWIAVMIEHLLVSRLRPWIAVDGSMHDDALRHRGLLGAELRLTSRMPLRPGGADRPIAQDPEV
jgi:hypothetical protein